MVDVCECPRCADTVRTFVPAAISRVAFLEHPAEDKPEQTHGIRRIDERRAM